MDEVNHSTSGELRETNMVRWIENGNRAFSSLALYALVVGTLKICNDNEGIASCVLNSFRLEPSSDISIVKLLKATRTILREVGTPHGW